MLTKQILVGLTASLMFLWSCEDIGIPNPIDETPPPDFGASYGVIETQTLPVLTSDSLFVRVAYSGCNGGHLFTLRYRVVDRTTVEIWLHKVTPDQMCEAYFEEIKGYRLPEAVRNYLNVVLLSPDGKRITLRPTSSTIYGKWNWLISEGGFGWLRLTPPPAVRIEYDRNGLFSYYRSDTLIATTPFTLRREKTIFSPDTCDVIHYQDPLRFVAQLFRIDNDTLKLTDLCIDCYGHAYRRIP